MTSFRDRVPWFFGPGRVTRYLYRLRTEGAGRGRQAAAIGLGVFIGCLPTYGLHVWICLAVGWLLRLNRLKMYLAANISNPFLAPFIVLAEIQTGSLVRRGEAYALTLAAVRGIDPWLFAVDLVVGSLLVGGVLGAVAAALTWALSDSSIDGATDELITEAAAAYLGSGLSSWELANGKLRLDPVYREVVAHVPLPDSGRVLDLGCGRGLMLALLAAHYRRQDPGWTSRVVLHGIEYRPRMVRLARRALGSEAVVEQADLVSCDLPPCRAVLLFDVLHCLPEPAQRALLERVRDALQPGGVVAIREANAAGGWRFTLGQLTNRLVAVFHGRWGRRFHFRSDRDWVVLLAGAGLVPAAPLRAQQTPYANVLLWARRPAEVESAGEGAVCSQ